ncbi:proline--tRNA ligase [Paenibacillus sp. FSL H8-0048]|uniref:proline--tRNA ligase n=1 Tax=Paenibacillus sp. FSL H8-0048 TaxID=2954508 RepID=UPI0030F7B25D
MRQTNLLVTTLREAPAEAETRSHQLLLRAGYIRQVAAGVYTYLPLGRRVLRRIEQIVRQEMESAGAQEVLMPSMQPTELWRESERYEVYGKELMKLRDRHDREFVLGPTHEEVVTALMRGEISSYRRLPVTVYQIQTKFRDERRPRSGLLRGREFLMKDAYSFDTDWEGLDLAYKVMYSAYERIFDRCGLKYRAVQANAGAIGGKGQNHEFMALSEIGEDTIAVCSLCGYAANLEQAEVHRGDCCPQCGEGELDFHQGIEVGHVFKLGTVYSEKLGAGYLDRGGRTRPMVMGCYGIGISRLLAAVAEQHNDDQGLIWPQSLAPYMVHILLMSVKDTAQRELAEAMYARLTALGIDTLLDDRDERPGVKFKDAGLLGIPVVLVVGKLAAEQRIEYMDRRTGNKEVIDIGEALLRVSGLKSAPDTAFA